MKNKAFTLAETLIVLSIIGILATVSLGVWSKMIPDKEKIMFKKAYQTVEKTAGELVNDENLYPYALNAIGFRNKENVTWPGENETFGGETKFCKLFERKLNVIVASRANECSTFTTSDGISYNIEDEAFGAGDDEATIFVDINGSDKDPNCIDRQGDSSYRVCSGSEQDIYRIFVSFDGRVRVESQRARDFLKSSTTTRD